MLTWRRIIIEFIINVNQLLTFIQPFIWQIKNGTKNAEQEEAVLTYDDEWCWPILTHAACSSLFQLVGTCEGSWMLMLTAGCRPELLLLTNVPLIKNADQTSVKNAAWASLLLTNSRRTIPTDQFILPPLLIADHQSEMLDARPKPLLISSAETRTSNQQQQCWMLT